MASRRTLVLRVLAAALVVSAIVSPTPVAPSRTAAAIPTGSGVADRDRRPSGTLALDVPSPTLAPSAEPIRTSPASGGPSRQLRGTATWYCSPGRSTCSSGFRAERHVAAASLRLRRAIGPGWRGTTVVVSTGSRSVSVVLVDTCGCPDGRLVDLYASAFDDLARLSRGVLKVSVSWP